MQTSNQRKKLISKETKAKLHAIQFILIISLASWGFVAILSVQNAFVDAAGNVYTVDYTVWINATGISPSALGDQDFKAIKLVVSKSLAADQLHSSADEGDRPFVPDALTQINMFQDAMENQQKPGGNRKNFAGVTVDMSNVQFGILESYVNGTTVGENSSEFFANFNKPYGVFSSVIERQLFFDSAENYAGEYCDLNGYTYQNVINATFQESWNPALINYYRSQLIKTDMMLTTAPPSRGNFSASSVHQNWIGAVIAIGIIVFLILTGPQLAQIIGTTVMAIHQATMDAAVTIEDIQAEKEIELDLVNSMDANIALIMELVENGTISLEAGLAAIAQLNAPYQDQLNNRTHNIKNILSDYFGHVENQWDKYATMFSTSWTDWLLPILGLIVAIIILVIIYKVVSRKKEGQPAVAPVTNVFQMPN